MPIVVRKLEEDKLLAKCDDTCEGILEGGECAAVKYLGTTVRGTALSRYELPYCVLCYRTMEEGRWRPYRVLPTGYPPQWFDSDMNIPLREEHYRVEGGVSVTQLVGEDSIVGEGIYDTLFDIETVKYTEYNPDLVSLTVCNNKDCKRDVLNLVDSYKGVGDRKTFIDLTAGAMICCAQCHHPVRFIEGVGKLWHGEKCYCRCHQCHTLTFWRRNTVIQMCTECDRRVKKSSLQAERVCFYCGDSIKKNNSQNLRVRKTRHGKVRTIFLCRNHRIFSHDEKKIYLESEISSFFAT